MKLKEIRKNSNTEPEVLADLLNISIQSYYRYEKGQNEPNIENLCKIADYFGVSLDYLCEHETQNKLELGYLDEQSKTLIKLIQDLNDKNKTQAIAYVSGLIAGQK